MPTTFRAWLRECGSNYKTKLLLAIFSVGFAMLFLLIANRIAITGRLLRERDTDFINAWGRFLANEMRNDLVDRDPEHLREVLALALQQPNLRIVSVVAADGTVTYCSDPRREHARLAQADTEELRIGPHETVFRTFLLDPPQPDGVAVQLGYATAQSWSALRSAMHRDLALGAAMLAAILVIAWAMSGILLRPLDEMKAVSRRIAAGDFSMRAHARSADIIGGLARALNDMAAQLGDLTTGMQKRIAQATLDLEQRNRELHEKTRQLEESNRKLMVLDELKSDFVSMVSHDLRTPLTSIIGFSHTLLNLPVGEDQCRRYLGIIESEGRRLAEMVEEYLDITKIESGSFALKLGEVDMAALAREVLEPLAVHAGVQVRLQAAPCLATAPGDAARLKRVLWNLLDNALKYTAPGTTVVVTVLQTAEAVGLSVRDRGPGLPPEEFTSIFQKFYRVKDKHSEHRRGSGLGLAIAKGIIAAHGGRIWVESELGQGATFAFCIPRQAAAPVADTAAPAPDAARAAAEVAADA